MSQKKKKKRRINHQEDRNAWVTAVFVVCVIITGAMHAMTMMAVSEAQMRLDAVEEQQGKIVMFLTGGQRQ